MWQILRICGFQQVLLSLGGPACRFLFLSQRVLSVSLKMTGKRAESDRLSSVDGRSGGRTAVQ